MCCSIRAAVFFLASLHVYFAVTQMIRVLPTAISSLSNRTLEAVMALIFALLFFSSGFMTFRGADEESQVLIAGGGVLLFLILGERFTLMYFGLMMNSSLPEGDFLSAYGDKLPIIFTVFLYLFYFGVLFGYHKELAEAEEDGSNSNEPFSTTLSPLPQSSYHRNQSSSSSGGGGKKKASPPDSLAIHP